MRLPWLRRRKKTAPEIPLKAPIQLGPFGNGEMFFTPGPKERLIEKLIFEKAEEGARRHNIDRREFLASSMGMATSLWAVNMVLGCSSDKPAAAVSGGTGVAHFGGGMPGSASPASGVGGTVVGAPAGSGMPVGGNAVPAAGSGGMSTPWPWRCAPWPGRFRRHER